MKAAGIPQTAKDKLSIEIERKISSEDSSVRLEVLQKLTKCTKSITDAAVVAVIRAVADRSKDVRDAAARALASCFQYTTNQENVFHLLNENGLKHSKWQNRLYTLLALQYLDIDKLTVLQNLLEEGIGPCLQDSQELVIQAAKQTLTHWETKDLTKDVKEIIKNEDITPTMEFGCVPEDVLVRLKHANWQTRSIALEEFHQYLTSVPVPLPLVVKNSVREVLELLSGLLADNNFKITLTSLYVIGDLIDAWGDNVIPVVGAILQGLFDKLGDNKIVIRQTAIKVFYKIFQQSVSLQKDDVLPDNKKITECDMSSYVPRLLQNICTGLAERNCAIRLSELISVIIMAIHVLNQSRCPYNHKMVVQALMDIARDPLVGAPAQLAIEALGFLQATLGPVRIAEMTELIAPRLKKFPEFGWPTVNDEGLVEYLYVNSKQSPTKRPPTRSPDLEKEWIPLQSLPEDGDVGSHPFWAERPCTAAVSVVGSESMKSKNSRLTLSTVSGSSRQRMSVGSLRSYSPSSSSEALTECRRSSLSSRKQRGGSSLLRVNFGDEEVLSPLSESRSPEYDNPIAGSDTGIDTRKRCETRGGPNIESMTRYPSFSKEHAQRCETRGNAETMTRNSSFSRDQDLFSENEGEELSIRRIRGEGLRKYNNTPCADDSVDQLLLDSRPVSKNLDKTQKSSYIPSSIQRPATRQVSKREGSTNNEKDPLFWEQFSSDKSLATTQKLSAAQSKDLKEKVFKKRSHTRSESREPEDIDNSCNNKTLADYGFGEDAKWPQGGGGLLSEESSVSPNPRFDNDRGSRRGWGNIDDASTTTKCSSASGGRLRNGAGNDSWGSTVSCKSADSIKEEEPFARDGAEYDDDALFQKSEATRRMLESMTPFTPDVPENFGDKLRLLKISSRASSRSNGRPCNKYMIHDNCRLEVVSPSRDDFETNQSRRTRRNTMGLTCREEQADFLDFRQGTDEARESLHSAPLPNTSARNRGTDILQDRKNDPLGRLRKGTTDMDRKFLSKGGASLNDVSSMADSFSTVSNRRNSKKRDPWTPSSAMASTTAQYLECNQLKPFAGQVSEALVRTIFNRLDARHEWTKQFEALDDLRRLAKFGPTQCSADERSLKEHYERFHQAVPLVVPLCDSPRSALAKNAIICLHDLYSLLPAKCMDFSIDITMPILLRKAVDTNGFVCNEALLGLRQMSLNLSISKLIPGTLVHLNAAKSAALRAKGLLVLCWTLLRMNDAEELSHHKDGNRVFQLIAESLEHTSADVRQTGRMAVQCLRDISHTNSTTNGGLNKNIVTIVQKISKESYEKMRACALRPRMEIPLL